MHTKLHIYNFKLIATLLLRSFNGVVVEGGVAVSNWTNIRTSLCESYYSCCDHDFRLRRHYEVGIIIKERLRVRQNHGI